MRWIRYDDAGRARFGILEGETVLAVDGAPWEAWKKTGRTVPYGDVKLLPPVEPRTFYAVGLNYAKHIREAAERRGEVANLPDKPDVGYRANNALIAHGDDIVWPEGAQKVHYEGELVAVIGKKTRHISREDALSAVLGWTIGNDMSERLWQKADRTFWRAKNADTFKPMGPWIDTDADPEQMETVVRVNGKQTIRFRTADMLFGVAEFISTMSQHLTLYPGDVLWMGTDGTSPDLSIGDEIEVELTGLGTLRNRIVAGGAA